MRPLSLVAMTISSRLVYSASARPTISSLDPSEYTFAVSNRVMPSSTARRMSGLARLLVQRPCVVAARRLSKRHAAQRDPGDLEAGAAEPGVVHRDASPSVARR